MPLYRSMRKSTLLFIEVLDPTLKRFSAAGEHAQLRVVVRTEESGDVLVIYLQ